MDYNAFITELRNAHGDTIEILSDKLRNWVSTAGQTTFNLSSGDFTVDNIPSVLAGDFKAEAGENITINTPVKIYDDGGTVKARMLKESQLESTVTAFSSGSAIYNSTYDKVLVAYQTSGDGVFLRIGTIASDGSMTFESEVTVTTDATASFLPGPMLLTMNGGFVLVYNIDDNIKIIGGKFTSATTLSLGAELDLSLSDVNYIVTASDLVDKVNVIYSKTDFTLNSTVIDFNSTTLIVAKVAGSDQTIQGTTGSDGVLSTAFSVGYNASDSLFHCLFTYGDGAGEFSLKHRYISLAGVLQGTADNIFTLSGSVGWWFPRAVFYDSGNDQIIAFVGALSSAGNNMFLMRFTNDSGSLAVATQTNLFTYEDSGSSPYPPKTFSSFYLSSESKIFTNYRNTLGANLITTSLELGNDIVESFEMYDLGGTASRAITVADSFLFLSTAGKAFTKGLEERTSFAGVAIESKTTGNDVSICLSGSRASTFIGLTIGARYYLQKDLSISTTKTSYLIGIAISATTLKLF